MPGEQREVVAALRNMGLVCKETIVDPLSGYKIQIALLSPFQNVIIEVDQEDCFLMVTSTAACVLFLFCANPFS